MPVKAKDHDLLIRIDERVGTLHNTLGTHIKQNAEAHKTMYESIEGLNVKVAKWNGGNNGRVSAILNHDVTKGGTTATALGIVIYLLLKGGVVA